MSEASFIGQVGGWRVEMGKAEGDGTPFASVFEETSQASQTFYADKDPMIVSFLRSLAGGLSSRDVNAEAAVVHERAECAKLLSVSNASLMLMAGEMTAGELRTTQAVLGGIQRLMLRREDVGRTNVRGGGDGAPHWLVRWR